MPLPSVPTCDIPVDVCSPHFEVAEALLETAWTALMDALDGDCPPVPHFVSVNEPSFTDQGEYVAVWLVDSSPAPGPRAAPVLHRFPRARATYGFKLMETGYPTLGGSTSGITTPDAERINAIARHSYAHAEAIQRALYRQFRLRDLPSGSCSYQTMGSLRPAQRSGGGVGWVFQLGLDVVWR